MNTARMYTIRSVKPVVLILLAALAAPVTAYAAEAGRLIYALGDVEVERAGTRAPAKWGARIEEGDTLHTGASGRTQIRMNDGALVSLRPGTSFLIEQMSLPVISTAAAAPAATAVAGVVQQPAAAVEVPGKAVMRLLRGGFRAVSGLIGKAGSDEYRVVTPVATIGIRGTDYRAVYCNADCPGASDGLHAGVSSGRIFLANDAGELSLAGNQYAYVSSATAAPERALEPPAVLDSPVEPTGENKGGSREYAQPPRSEPASATEPAPNGDERLLVEPVWEPITPARPQPDIHTEPSTQPDRPDQQNPP